MPLPRKLSRCIICLISFTLALDACSPRIQQNADSFKIIGYVSGGRVDTTAIQYDLLTHINFAFAIPASAGDGSLAPLEHADELKALVRNAHAHDVKVFISVGGWNIGDGGGNDLRFEQLAAHPETRTRFTGAVLQLVRRYSLDGADIDWEYPDPNDTSSQHYIMLMQQLADSLHAIDKKLSAAIVSKGKYAPGIRSEIFSIADWLSIMAYDDDYNSFHGARVPHSPYSLAEEVLDYWVSQRGLSREKAILGVPFYGKPWSPISAYKALLKAGADPTKDHFDSLYYNGMTTMKAKTKLALKNAGGIMIWELPLDATGKYSLLRAIHETVK